MKDREKWDYSLTEYAIRHALCRIEDIEGMKVNLSDLPEYLVEREMCDNVVFYNNYEAWKFISRNREELAEVLDHMNIHGESINLLDYPDSFCVFALEFALREILEEYCEDKEYEEIVLKEDDVREIEAFLKEKADEYCINLDELN